MKHMLLKTLLIYSTVIFASTSYAATPMDMPVFEDPTAMSVDQLRSEIPKLNRALGANPPSFFNVNHKNQIYKQWSEYLGAALILQPKSKDEATEKVHILATLFVQGYNLNVTGMAVKAHEAIQFCLKVAPESSECKLLSAMFYMSADATKLEEVKQTLFALREQYGKHKNAEVEIALAYYHIYANDHKAALEQIDAIDVFFEHLYNDNIKKYRLEHLKEFKVAILLEQAKKQDQKQTPTE
ncbi:hypothetical protein [Marinicellulosiphila megalodicopiae]|uniref:hypothetical protein n=1 Tax=Marinicellulosiphila megalodicopiae TaxID=2724896 RepID=UPI003BAF18EC